MNPLQFNPVRLISQAEGRAAALANQRLSQGNALQRMQMEAAQQQQAQQEQQRNALQQFTQSMPSPQMMAAQQGLAGGGGPTQANAARMPQVDPRLQMLFEAMKAGAVDPMAYANQAYPAQREVKIKDYKPIRNPDGSVSYVGLTDDGKVVQTGQQPFEKAEVRDFGGHVGGIDPITGKVTRYGDKTQSPDSRASTAVQIRGQNMTDARARQAAAPMGQPGGGKPMTELQLMKRRDQIAKDHKAAETTLANMDDLITSANEVLSAPGLKGATGVQSYFPSWPDGGAARAEVKLKNLEGKVTQLGKAAAAMAGAIGPMAVQEWKIVRDMIAAIEPQKGEEALKEQIRLVESTAQGAAQRIREAYERQYAPDFERFPEFQELPEPKQKAATPAGPEAWDENKKKRYEAWKRANGGGR